MRYENVCIEGFGYVIPEQVVTSDWVEEQLAPIYEALGVPRGRIEQLTKIRERRWWPEDMRYSEGAAMAAEEALKRTGIDRSEIQCLVNTSVCRDYIEPATSTIVHDKLGLDPTAMNFDMVNACLGFLNGMVVVANMIELGQIDTGMVVSCEGTRQGYEATIERLLSQAPDMQDFRDSLATFTLGSGAVAMIMRHKKHASPGSPRVLGGSFYSQTQHNDLCVAQTDWMRTNSTPLLHRGLEVIAAAWEQFQVTMGWNAETVDKVFTHQVSEKQREMGLKMIGLDRGIDYPTLIELGNIASVSAPLSMALAIDNGFVNKGDKVSLVGVGSGINSLILGIEW